jgi:hypothetical protein
MEAQGHPLVVAIPKGASKPPRLESPHTVIEPSALRAAKAVLPRFIQLMTPLPPLKPMAQSRRGVIRVMEAQGHPLIVAIPRFIQIGMPLPPLKPMAQSRCGVRITPHRD